MNRPSNLGVSFAIVLESNDKPIPIRNIHHSDQVVVANLAAIAMATDLKFCCKLKKCPATVRITK